MDKQAINPLVKKTKSEEYKSNFVKVFKEFVAGTVGGVCKTFVGQPFDIVKVRLQSTNIYNGAFDCLKKIVSQEGVLALYKGTLSPLIGAGFCVAIQFASLGTTKMILEDINRKRGFLNPRDFTVGQFFLCGGIAGAANALVSIPVEHIRIKLQLQKGSTNKLYSGSIDAFSKITRTYGLKGLYYGTQITMLREVIGFSCYFGMYEIMKKRAARKWGDKPVPFYIYPLLGGVAGYFLWLPTYPIDVIKSKIQADSISNPKYKSISDAVKITWAEAGWRGFFKGFVPCMLRAAPVNATVFGAYEMTIKLLKRE